MQEVLALENRETKEQKYKFFCFRCGCIIRTGEKMVNLLVNVETLVEDRTLNVIESTAISTLCPGCASVLLSKAITSDSMLMMPREQESEEDDIEEIEEDNEITSSENEEDKPQGKLGIRYSKKGFRLALDCGDGISKATSQFFTWRQIAQMLIAVDPNIFGILSEPLHQVFPRALTRLGYHVPDWRDHHCGSNLN
jgi:hypothetical protein